MDPQPLEMWCMSGAEAGKPKREVPPPFAPEEWARVGDVSLDAYAPGVLLAIFDRRPLGELDALGGSIIGHLMVITRRTLEKFIPGDRNKQRRKETEGRILDHISHRDGPISFRTNFLSAIMKEVAKYDQDLHRVDERPAKALHGASVEPWLLGNEQGLDAYEKAELTAKLRELFDRVDDPDVRCMISMHILGYTFDEIGERFGLEKEAARLRVREHLPAPPPMRRQRPGMRMRQLEAKRRNRP